MQQLSALQNKVNAWLKLRQEVDDTRDLLELSLDDTDETAENEYAAEVVRLEKIFTEMEFLVMLSGKHDADDAAENGQQVQRRPGLDDGVPRDGHEGRRKLPERPRLEVGQVEPEERPAQVRFSTEQACLLRGVHRVVQHVPAPLRRALRPPRRSRPVKKLRPRPRQRLHAGILHQCARRERERLIARPRLPHRIPDTCARSRTEPRLW